MSDSEDWLIPRIKTEPPQWLQISGENICQTTSWVSFKYEDKRQPPSLNFPLNCLELYLIYDNVLSSSKLSCGFVLETVSVRLNERYLSSLVPHHGCSRVVDGGQFWLRVLGEEKRLLAPPQRGWGLPAQGPCGCPTWEDKRQMNKATNFLNTRQTVQP